MAEASLLVLLLFNLNSILLMCLPTKLRFADGWTLPLIDHCDADLNRYDIYTNTEMITASLEGGYGRQATKSTKYEKAEVKKRQQETQARPEASQQLINN